MPSGPKKRRAAKKKNDTIATTPTNLTEEKPVDAVELSNVASNVFEMTVGDDVNTKTVTEMETKENEEKESSIEPTSEKIERIVCDDVFKCFLQNPPVFGNPFWLDVLKNAQMGLEGSGTGLSVNQLNVSEISYANETEDPFAESVIKEVQDSLKDTNTNHEPPAVDQPVLDDNVACCDQTTNLQPPAVDQPVLDDNVACSDQMTNLQPQAVDQPVLNDNVLRSDQMDVFRRVHILVNALGCQSAEMKLLAEKVNMNLSKLMDELNSEMLSRVTGLSKDTAKFDSQTTEPDVFINEEKEHSKSFVNAKETSSPLKPEDSGLSYKHEHSSSPNHHKQVILGFDFEDTNLLEQVIDNDSDSEQLSYLREQAVAECHPEE